MGCESMIEFYLLPFLKELRSITSYILNQIFRVFIVLSIPLKLVTFFQYNLSFTNKFYYSLEILSQTLVIFWCIYLKSFLIVNPFIGFMGKQ